MPVIFNTNIYDLDEEIEFADSGGLGGNVDLTLYNYLRGGCTEVGIGQESGKKRETSLTLCWRGLDWIFCKGCQELEQAAQGNGGVSLPRGILKMCRCST